MADSYPIDVHNLSYSYDNTHIVLNNISFTIPEKSIITILGKNGVGKTTLLNCFLGLIQNYSGKIQVYGKNLEDYSRKDLAKMIGLVPQLGMTTFDYTVEEFVLMGCASQIGYLAVPHKEASFKIDQILETLQISKLKHRMVNELSGGERQLVYIARTLVQNPKIIVMDEPTSALDFGHSYSIMDLIVQLRDMGYTIIMTCHNPNYPFILHDYSIAMFEDKSIIFGKSEEILSSSLLSSLYGISIKRVFIPEFSQYVCLKDTAL